MHKAYTLLLICNYYLAKHHITVLSHPSYSPDLVPAEIFLFQKSKSTLKGHFFQTINSTEKNMIQHPHAILIDMIQKAFQNGRNAGRDVLATVVIILKKTS